MIEHQIYSAIHAAEGRLSCGATPEAVFDWLREEVAQILKGEVIYQEDSV